MTSVCKKRFRWSAILAWLLVAIGLPACAPPPSEDEVVIFGAASLRDVLVEVGVAFQDETALIPVFSFAGSNVLARQLEAAPLGDVFLSANDRWMDFLDERSLLVPESRRAVLINELVLIVHRDAEYSIDGPSWLAGGSYRYVAMADPDSVPAGQYTKAYLESVPSNGLVGSLWNAVEGRVAPAADVRSALALVAADPEIVGIVYRTDALTSDRVRIAYEIPPWQTPNIRYPAGAILNGPNPPGALRFLDFLQSVGARAIFERHGFSSAIGSSGSSSDPKDDEVPWATSSPPKDIQ